MSSVVFEDVLQTELLRVQRLLGRDQILNKIGRAVFWSFSVSLLVWLIVGQSTLFQSVDIAIRGTVVELPGTEMCPLHKQLIEGEKDPCHLRRAAVLSRHPGASSWKHADCSSSKEWFSARLSPSPSPSTDLQLAEVLEDHPCRFLPLQTHRLVIEEDQRTVAAVPVPSGRRSVEDIYWDLSSLQQMNRDHAAALLSWKEAVQEFVAVLLLPRALYEEYRGTTGTVHRRLVFWTGCVLAELLVLWAVLTLLWMAWTVLSETLFPPADVRCLHEIYRENLSLLWLRAVSESQPPLEQYGKLTVDYRERLFETEQYHRQRCFRMIVCFPLYLLIILPLRSILGRPSGQPPDLVRIQTSQ